MLSAATVLFQNSRAPFRAGAESVSCIASARAAVPPACSSCPGASPGARALRRTVETRSRPSSARPQGCFQTQTTAGCRGEVGTSADCQTRRPSPPLCVRAAVRSDPPGRLLRKAEDVLFLKLTVRLTLSFRVLGPQCATRPTGTSRKGRQRRDCGDAMSSHRCWCVG